MDELTQGQDNVAACECNGLVGATYGVPRVTNALILWFKGDIYTERVKNNSAKATMIEKLDNSKKQV